MGRRERIPTFPLHLAKRDRLAPRGKGSECDRATLDEAAKEVRDYR